MEDKYIKWPWWIWLQIPIILVLNLFEALFPDFYYLKFSAVFFFISAVSAFYLLRKPNEISWMPLMVLFGYLLFVFVWKGGQLGFFFKLCGSVLFFFFLFSWFKDKHIHSLLFKIIIIYIGLVILLFFCFDLNVYRANRLYFLAMNPNFAAMIFACITLFLNKFIFKYNYFFVLLLLFWLLLIQTGSRGIFLATFLASCFQILPKLKIYGASWRSMIFYGFIVALVLLIFILLFTPLGSRFLHLLTNKNGRLFIGEAYWEAFKLNPWFGEGVGAKVFVNQGVSGNFRSSHNDFIFLLHSFGIIGSVIFIISAYFATIKSRFNWYNMGILVFIFISMMTNNWLSWPVLWIFLTYLWWHDEESH